MHPFQLGFLVKVVVLQFPQSLTNLLLIPQFDWPSGLKFCTRTHFAAIHTSLRGLQFSAIQVEQAAKSAVDSHHGLPAWMLPLQKCSAGVLYIGQAFQDMVMMMPLLPTLMHPLHQLATKLINHSYFSNFIMLVIILNTIVMAAVYHEAPKGYLQALESINTVLTWVFIMEFALKHISLGVRGVIH
jgi:hypothetical protein